MRKPAEGYDLSAEDLWKHSMATALTSSNLCQALKIKDQGQIFTAAILHDIGKIVLGEFILDSFEDIIALANEKNIPFEEAEGKISGIDHAEIGGLIAEYWDFPQEIVDCIKFHHDPDGAEDTTTAIAIVHISDALCLMTGFGIGRDGLQYRPNAGSIKRLGISSSILELVTSQTLASLDEIEGMFKDKPVEEVAVKG